MQQCPVVVGVLGETDTGVQDQPVGGHTCGPGVVRQFTQQPGDVGDDIPAVVGASFR